MEIFNIFFLNHHICTYLMPDLLHKISKIVRIKKTTLVVKNLYPQVNNEDGVTLIEEKSFQMYTIILNRKERIQVWTFFIFKWVLNEV